MSNYKKKRYRKNGKDSVKYAIKLAKAAYRKTCSELKYLDTSSSGGAATPGLSDTVIQCANITQGDGARSREGNSICVRSILMRQHWTINPLTVITNCRYLLVVDTQPNNATLAIDNVLQSTGTGLNIITPLQFDQGGRYKVLADGRFCLSVEAAGWNGVSTILVSKDKFISKYIKLKKPLEIKYNDNLGTVADIQKNNIALILLSDEGTLKPVVNYHVRLRFTDN